MATVRETVRLGLAARGQAKLKVRQPLRAAVVVAAGAEREAIERLADVALEELNVKELRYVSQADELGSYEVKPNYRALGPRFGKSMPQVAAAVAALDPAARRRAPCATAAASAISIDGHDHELDADDLMLAMKPARRLPARARGLARRRAGARARRRAAPRGPGPRDRPRDPERPQDRRPAGRGPDRAAARRRAELLEAAREHEAYVARETLATSVAYDGAAGVEPVKIEGHPLHIAVTRA